MTKTRQTTIQHEPRKRLKLSLEQYCLADTIDKLQNNPRATWVGWCNAKKATLASMLDISESSVKRYLKHLLDQGITEKKHGGKLVRTTEIWYDNVTMYRENRYKKQSVEGQSDPSHVPQGSNRPSKRVNLTHGKGQSDPSARVNLTPLIDIEYKILSNEKGYMIPNTQNTFSSENLGDYENQINDQKESTPPVAPAPPAIPYLEAAQRMREYLEDHPEVSASVLRTSGYNEAKHGKLALEVQQLFAHRAANLGWLKMESVEQLGALNKWLIRSVEFKNANHVNATTTNPAPVSGTNNGSNGASVRDYIARRFAKLGNTTRDVEGRSEENNPPPNAHHRPQGAGIGRVDHGGTTVPNELCV